jgi:hypothetical protein
MVVLAVFSTQKVYLFMRQSVINALPGAPKQKAGRSPAFYGEKLYWSTKG